MIEATNLVVRGHVSSTVIIDVCSQFFLAHRSSSGCLCFGAIKRCFAGSRDATLWFVLLVLILAESVPCRVLDVAASFVDYCHVFCRFSGRVSTLRSFQTRETEMQRERERECVSVCVCV